MGETLEARLAKGALPFDQTLEYAIQIADALDKAHRQGVVHRDLKPGNIMLVKSGAKLLDFGLAKLQAADTPTNLSALPTEQANLTAEGTILGTLQYMAPEQLEGKEADSRTDIFAFGATVYEMATGKKAFEGKSQASLIGAIMNSEPQPMSELKPMTPELLDWVAKRCLAKDPDERVQTAGDLMAELRLVREVGTPVDFLPSHTASVPLTRMITWVAATAVLAALGAGLIATWLAPSGVPPTRRFFITNQEGDHDQLLGITSGYDMRLTPDGSELLYLARQEGITRLYRRPMNNFGATAIPDTEGAYEPFFSPNGQSLGFLSGVTLKTMAFPSGTPLDVADLGTSAAGATWLNKDTIVVGMRQRGLIRVSVSRGIGEPLTVPDPEQGDTEHNWPEALPGGQALLFTALHGPDLSDARIAVWSAETDDWTIVLEEEGYNARYLPTGHLIYGRAELVMAVEFDLDSLEVTGKSIPSPEYRRHAECGSSGVYRGLGRYARLCSVANDRRGIDMDGPGRNVFGTTGYPHSSICCTDAVSGWFARCRRHRS